MNVEELARRVAAELIRVEGVAAVVLGGSRARGNPTADSDLDLGIYYDPRRPLDMDALDRLATGLDDRGGRGLVSPIGGWGPWINGGAWLRVEGLPVDLIYRDLARVGRVVEDCCQGRLEVDYQPGHPHAFVSAIYLGELAHAKVLQDPGQILAPLKGRADPYPPMLRRALFDRFGWEAGFALANARKALPRKDASYLLGSGFRALSALLQVLFALNGEYCLNEKGAVALADGFALAPKAFRIRLEGAMAELGGREPVRGLEDLEALAREVGGFLDGARS